MNQKTETENKRLAESAPELLLSLKMMVDFYSIHCVGENEPQAAKYAVSIKRLARLAIARAMGEIQ